MAAPRASSFKALQNLSKPSRRSLHMTGSQSSPRAIDGNHKTTYLPWGLQELRQECRKRTLTASGTKHELIDRLASHDGLQSRAFSIAMRRIAKEQTAKPVSGPTEVPSMSRSFNTSRANKAVNDNSTVDFAYLPKLFSPEWGVQPAVVRVPILPSIFSDDAEERLERFPSLEAAAGGYQGSDGGDARIMKPQIETVNDMTSAEMSHLSDVGDGHTTEMTVDQLSELSNILGTNAKKFVEMVKDKDEGTIRQLWSGFLDDLLGSKNSSTKA